MDATHAEFHAHRNRRSPRVRRGNGQIPREVLDALDALGAPPGPVPVGRDRAGLPRDSDDAQRARRRGDRPAPGPAAGSRQVLTIPGWHPSRINQWDGRHWSVRSRLKRADRDMVAAYALVAGLIDATSPRRVDLHITLGPGKRSPDRDAWWKSVLDALVHARLLVDDNPRWCEPGFVAYDRAAQASTTITLTDLPESPR